MRWPMALWRSAVQGWLLARPRRLGSTSRPPWRSGAGLGDGVTAGSDTALGATTSLGVGAGVGLGVGLGVGFGVGLGVGLGVAFGVGAGVAGAVIVTEPAPIDALKRSRLMAWNVTAWVPGRQLARTT